MSEEHGKADKAIIESDPNDTMEEAPTITEELDNYKNQKDYNQGETYDTKKVREESLVTKKEKVSKRPVKQTKISHFQAMALMGKALFGIIRKDKESKTQFRDLYSSSGNEDNSYDEDKLSKHVSQTYKRSKDDIQKDNKDEHIPIKNEWYRMDTEKKKYEELDREILPQKIKVGNDIDMDEVDEVADRIQASLNKKKDAREALKMKNKNDDDFKRGNALTDKTEVSQDHLNVRDSVLEEEDFDDVDKVAAQIQASLNKKKENRKSQKKIPEEPEETLYFESEEFEEDCEESSEEIIDIDLDDPQVDKAALKIQSSFRGHQARKEVKELQSKQKTVGVEITKSPEKDYNMDSKNSDTDCIDIDLEDPEVDKAALKIQSSFRGHQARKELKEQQQKEIINENEEINREKYDRNLKAESTKDDDIDIDLEDPEVDKAALKIQSSFRGHKARKELKEQKPKEIHPNGEFDKEKKSKDKQIEGNIQEDEIDIDLEDPEVGKAALKIQSSFRGHQARKELNVSQENKNTVDNKSPHTEKNDKNIKIQEINAEEELDIDLEDPEVGKAALKIQSSFRGHQARKGTKELKGRKQMSIENGKEIVDPLEANIVADSITAEEHQMNEEKTDIMEGTEEIDIDLEDPEVDKAALKIQSNFRGHQARKEIKEKRIKNTEEEADKKVKCIDLKDPCPMENNNTNKEDRELSEVEAATKIQSGFRGAKARNEVQKIKEEKTQQALRETEAATKIQSGFRGAKARNEVKEMRKEIDEKSKGVMETQKKDADENNKTKDHEFNEDSSHIDWDDTILDDVATKVQAGYKGMKVREDMKIEEANDLKIAAKRGKEMEERLGISLNDPEVVNAATKIQAGFRGVRARRNLKNKQPPQIEVDEPTVTEYSECDSENSYTYTYEDEDEESESLEERPISPKTAVEDFSKTFSVAGFRASAMIGAWNLRRKRLMAGPMTSIEENDAATKIQAGYKGMITRQEMKKPVSIAGFKATASIGAWVKRRQLRQQKPLEGEEEDDVATKIQAGYRGMKVREEIYKKPSKKLKDDSQKCDDSGTEISGNTSPEDGRITAVETDERNGVDSGTSFSSREVTPRQEKDKLKGTNEEEYDDNFEEASNESEEGSCKSYGSGVEDNSESEDDTNDSKRVEGKTPFVLLKRLVGIMQTAGTSKKAFMRQNKIGFDDKPELETEKGQMPDFSGKSSSQIASENEESDEDQKEKDGGDEAFD